ncbi:MAG TPA: hypothetical protein VJT49_12130 [Amycolatopsis sp.]|uniref:hypothetical protein n=1 Tax=Amycolatopsis sp. TaxID=37632 RepID=UPI002B476474|nr:hypothetical protein [Amycolatopsis sp.]HKS45834.1 hypothetical protein [Amycolatopsis sp.]
MCSDGRRGEPGCRYIEDVTGTNALARPFEIRQGISVIGVEHFLEPLKAFRNAANWQTITLNKVPGAV